MRVKVIKASEDVYWYAKHIGEEFEVEDGIDGDAYLVIDSNIGVDYYIGKNDCEVINKENKIMTKYETMCDTYKHKQTVNKFINLIIMELMDRAVNHDNSKLENFEVDIFTKYTPKLASCTYGSDEYKQFLKEMKPALDHHYENNRHHPEYHINGIKDMDLVDLIEMMCDWKAASLRHNNGDIYKSIELNQNRFGYGDELKQIFENTVRKL
jgi:hypothetical protein